MCTKAGSLNSANRQGSTERGHHLHNLLSQKASRACTQLKDVRFSGDITGALELTVREYNVSARQHSLSPTEKADFITSAFSKPAHTYFYINAIDAMTFEEMVQMKKEEYESDAQQEQALTQIQNRSLKRYMKDHRIIDEHEDLTTIVNTIQKVTPQFPPELLSETNKFKRLGFAVFDYHWPENPL